LRRWHLAKHGHNVAAGVAVCSCGWRRLLHGVRELDRGLRRKNLPQHGHDVAAGVTFCSSRWRSAWHCRCRGCMPQQSHDARTGGGCAWQRRCGGGGRRKRLVMWVLMMLLRVLQQGKKISAGICVCTRSSDDARSASITRRQFCLVGAGVRMCARACMRVRAGPNSLVGRHYRSSSPRAGGGVAKSCFSRSASDVGGGGPSCAGAKAACPGAGKESPGMVCWCGGLT
jgi:hypothetical protein